MTTNLEILRDRGSMTLRELCGAISAARGHAVYYDDLDGVMHAHLERGEVTREKADDWRNDVWAAVAQTPAETHQGD